jgi:two-component system cell cycle sensor histidine kinase/response regulator CckA
MPGSRILIVEDEQNIAADMRTILERHGYEVPAVFSSGEEAIGALERMRPDLILMDIRLGGEMDGLETARLIRENCDTPIILIAGHADEFILERAKQTRLFGYILKPVDDKELRTAIEIALYRHGMERKLLERERLFFTTLNSIGEAVIVTNRENRIEYLNPVAESFAGASLDQAFGAEFDTIFTFSACDIPRCRELHLPNGAVIPVEVKPSPLRHAETQEHGTVWIIHDISDRVEVENALRRSEERYRKFFEDDLAGDFVARADGRITDCNLSFVMIFRFDSIEDACSRNINEFFADEASRRRFWEAVYREKKVEMLETVFLAADARPITVLANVVGQFSPSGQLEEVKGYFFDTTERRRLEEQLRHAQKMEAIGRLAGGIAHDFNNILTVIMGYGNLVLESLPEESEIRSDVEGIQKAAKKGVTLTRQLLTFSRNQVMKLKVTNLNLLVADMEKMLRRLVTEDISMHLYLDANPANVYIDQGQIEQALMNLAVNARDAMPQGGSLFIRTESVLVTERLTSPMGEIPMDSYIVLSVRDTGIGMDEKTKLMIFEPFFTTKSSSQGTGLGLSTVYGSIKQCGGYIRVESEVGKGSTFFLYFPRVDEPSEDEISREDPGVKYSGTETILLVEDEDNVRTLISRMLSAKGYQVLEAQNPGEALLICEQYKEKIDLLISDIVMPHVTGNRLAERLVQIRPDIKVLLMSGYPDRHIAELGLVPGQTEFIQKPFELEVFSERVRRVLDEV